MENAATSSATGRGVKIKTIEEVRDEFCRGGYSITDWASDHGYPVYLVQRVLSGKARCLRGKSHEVAVLLGIKDGYIRATTK